jgi:hypothetical protein
VPLDDLGDVLGRTVNRRGMSRGRTRLAAGQLDGLVADDDRHAALEA